MAKKSKGTLFGKPQAEVIKHPGSETRRAKKNGRSLHAQAEIDSHSPNKRIRGKGDFALAAQSGKLGKAKKRDHLLGKRRAKKLHDRRKRTARKRA